MITVLIGPSGAGKDALLAAIKEAGVAKPIVSFTTRPKRENEIDGVHYNFISDEQFSEIEHNFFQKREYETILNGKKAVWKYAMPWELDDGNHCIIVNKEGFESIAEHFGRDNVFNIYIHVSDNIRRERAEKRGSFCEQEWNRRLEDDRRAFGNLDYYDYVVNNNGDFHETLNKVVDIIKSEHRRHPYVELLKNNSEVIFEENQMIVHVAEHSEENYEYSILDILNGDIDDGYLEDGGFINVDYPSEVIREAARYAN